MSVYESWLGDCTIGLSFLRKLGAYMASVESLGSMGIPPPGQGVRGTQPGIMSFRSANEAQICLFLLSCKLLKYTF